MALSAFADKTKPPLDREVAAMLGRALPAWEAIRSAMAARVEGLVEEWGYTSASTGWGLRLKLAKRVILYLTPRQGSCLVSTALGEKAVKAARERKACKALLAVIDAAPKFAEGRGVRLEVRTLAQARAAVELGVVKAES